MRVIKRRLSTVHYGKLQNYLQMIQQDQQVDIFF